MIMMACYMRQWIFHHDWLSDQVKGARVAESIATSFDDPVRIYIYTVLTYIHTTVLMGISIKTISWI